MRITCDRKKYQTISKDHCHIKEKNNEWWITDTSTNGTVVNNVTLKADSQRLKVGDEICVGNACWKFQESQAIKKEDAVGYYLFCS